MSHEGIRIIGQDEATRTAKEDARNFTADEVTPAKVRARITEGTGLEIEWKDGHLSAWDFAWLRDACPCATCHEARQAAGLQPGEKKPEPVQLLPMYKEKMRPTEATPVGRYAISFRWNDGHTSGIYSWDYLRRLCRCFVCKAELDLE